MLWKAEELMAKIELRPRLLNNIERCRERAAQVRFAAEHYRDPVAKRMTLEIAASYDRLVASAELDLDYLRARIIEANRGGSAATSVAPRGLRLRSISVHGSCGRV
jgi:hypothetical protein